MHISSIGLSNFKCFKKANLEFSKITLLTGKNSSGKSSSICGLLAALQSDFPLFLSPFGRYVNLGDFYEMAYDHNTESEIGICLKLEDGALSPIVYDTTWISEKNSRMPILKSADLKTAKFSLNIELVGNKYYVKGSPEFKSEIDQYILGTIRTADLFSRRGTTSTGSKKTKVKLTKKGLEFPSLQHLLDSWSGEYRNYYYHIISLIGLFKGYEENFNHISAFRFAPERTYPRISSKSDKVGTHGEYALDQLLDWHSVRSIEYKKLRESLKNMSLLSTISFVKSRGGKYEPRMRVLDSGRTFSIVDVGFGISQFLPIIIADYQLGKASTLSVAQPEIHLHPSAQADSADFFIRQAKSNNKRYILETHSEYLINRLRLAVIRGELSTDDVAVHHFYFQDNDVCIADIRFNKDGTISNAPEDFFNTYLMDTINIALESIPE